MTTWKGQHAPVLVLTPTEPLKASQGELFGGSSPVYAFADQTRGRNLRDCRYEAGLSPVKAAERLGITVDQLSDAEAGKYDFDASHAAALLAKPL